MPRKLKRPKGITGTDAMLGARLRAARIEKHRTQGDVARALGLSVNQVHKYETGADRLSVARLLQIAAQLGVPAAELIEGLG